MRKSQLIIILAFAFFLVLPNWSESKRPVRKPTAVPTPTGTLISKATSTPTRTPMDTPTNTDTNTPTDTPTLVDTEIPTNTVLPTDTPTQTDTPTITLTPTITPSVTYTPWPNAPLCPDVGTQHELSVFHTLWDDVRGCHYDHEHGENPFTPDVVAAFSGFDLQSLLGGVQIGDTNPSSPTENTVKHGGFKWQVQTLTPGGCDNYLDGLPFEGAQYGIKSAVVEYHNFGDYSLEFEARLHSAAALLAICSRDNPSDVGYMFVGQLEDYGQRVIPYQGEILDYPNNPIPAFDSALGPYFTDDCVNGGVIQCRSSLSFIVSHNLNVNSIWTSKPTGFNANYPGNSLLKILFRVRDVYKLFDWNDQTYPYTFLWVCSSDNGLTYNPIGCRWNNSANRIHELAGTIPASWDNLEGFDTNPVVGRITADGYIDRFGRTVNLSCTTPSDTCYPIKLVNMFVGTYGDELTPDKVSFSNLNSFTPERDIYFCAGIPCLETDPGAIPSGWIGPNN